MRGYEWSKGKYVVVSDEDIDSVPLKTMRAIEIEMFINASRDGAGTQFVKQAYYLEPEQIGAKAFYLLKSVLAEQNKSAICKIVLKDREQLAALNPFAKTMLLTTLHWPDEVRADRRAEPSRGRDRDQAREKKMAEQLVASMTGEFNADDYADDYRQALMAVIEKKVAGEKPEPQAPRRADEHHRPHGGARGIGLGRRARTGRRAKADAGARQGPRRSRQHRAKAPAKAKPAKSEGGAPPAPPQDGLTRRVVPGEQLDLSDPGARGLPSRLPARVAPMQPSDGLTPFDDPAYLFEPWWPGIRAHGLGRGSAS